MDSFTAPDQHSYNVALEQERRIYDSCVDVHHLPKIFHYWSHRYLRPKLRPYGFDDPNAMFKKYLEERCRNSPDEQLRFVSLGSGNCDLEIEIALHLRARGLTGFTIECLDLNTVMLERGRVGAAKAGIDSQMRFAQGDLNAWNPDGEYDAALANQSLHHVVNLEGLFEQVKRSLRSNGLFLISDMIGRNGHQRWPEALHIVREFWRTLPPSYRFNPRLGFYDEFYEDWDCSVEGFEGVRAQDILPLLVDHFHFQLFLPFGNVIDPFIDRTYGHNFDAGAQWDQDFIDRVHLRDEQEIACGHLKPTHMLAVIGKDPNVSPVFPENLSPRFCLRLPETTNGATVSAGSDSYEWGAWPHSSETELRIACQRLADAGRKIRQSALQFDKELKERTAWALRLDKELKERTEWALGLDKELEERTAWALGLDKELKERTAWALGLNKEVEERTAWALRLDKELEERTAWALRLNKELEARTEWASRLDKELAFRTTLASQPDKELEERTAWAMRLDKELEERTAWALRLNKELEEQTALASRLQRELQRQTGRAAQFESELRLPGDFLRFAKRFVASVRNRLKRST
jgi:SAM-dependent methyltransferase